MNYLKFICLLLIAVTDLSCKKKRIEPIYEPQRICFEAEVMSKSYVNDANDQSFKTTGLGVFVKKVHSTDGTTELMDNVNVKNDTGKGWNYTGNYFWGLDCDHYFLAVYPFDANTNKPTPADAPTFSNGVYTWKNIETANATGTDLLYGRYQMHFSIDQTPAPVPLEMRHALSAISFTLRNVSNQTYKEMTSLTLGELFTKATTVKVTREGDTIPEIVVDKASNTGTYTFSYAKSMPTDPMNSYPIVPTFVIIPQDFTNYGSIPLNIKLDTGNLDAKKDPIYKTVYIDLAKYKVDNKDPHDIYKYLSGHHYNYNIDITEKGITVSVSVVPWINDDIVDL